MRSVFLAVMLGLATLGTLAVSPSTAEAQPWRYGRYSYYGGPYRNWRGGGSYYYPGYSSYYYPRYSSYYYPRYSSYYYAPAYRYSAYPYYYNSGYYTPGATLFGY